MTIRAEQTLREKFSFTSSIAADVWTPKPCAEAYEWWYFDAISDDGRDSVVIIFLDNFIFSPRYNRRKGEWEKGREEEKPAGKETNPQSAIRNPQSNFPAVAFTFYRDGKPLYRAINEFSGEEFSASETEPSCKIGENFFRFERAPYGSGYLISIKTTWRKNCSLEAQFEWLAIESDFLPEKPIGGQNAHVWNLVVARADVSGRVVVKSDQGKELNTLQFRGTGYHDHNYDNRWLPETVQDWQWGRAHFTDCSTVFYRYKEHGAGGDETTKLFTIRNGELRARDAEYEEQQFARDIFGIKYPQRLTFLTEDNMRLRVKQTQIIDASFFYLRFLSEMTLTLRDGKPRKSVGITEYLNPKALKYRWLDWLVSMRIGRNSKGAFLP